MTDLRNMTILGMIARLNMLIDEGNVAPPPEEVKRCIADESILDCLGSLYGKFPEFSPVHKAEAVLLLKELKAVLEIYYGREDSKMGVRNNGLCLLVGYCIEMLSGRHAREVLG
jgi:hypothetical protein